MARALADAGVLTAKGARDALVKLFSDKSGISPLSAGLQSGDSTPVQPESPIRPQPASTSFTRVLIPVRSDLTVRDKYVSFGGKVRFGKILEDLDTAAALACYKHNVRDDEEETRRLTIVTAAVDNMLIHEPETTPQDGDLVLSAWVSWVGKSSMEVSMQLHSELKQNDSSILDAKFVMVARDSEYRAAPVNPLDLMTDVETKSFNDGEQRRALRKSQADQSLLLTKPSAEEAMLIHSMFLSTLDKSSKTFNTNVKPEKDKWMKDSKLKTSILCFPEDRNIHGKIFGGFVMRKALEHSWSNAYVHCEKLINPVFIDDIAFKRPVSIGDLLYLSSNVVYTEGNLIQVRCHAEVKNVLRGTQETTNEFHFTFAAPQASDVPSVVPVSYAQYMMYLDGKRHLHHYTQQQRNC